MDSQIIFRRLGRQTYQHIEHTEAGNRRPETGSRWQGNKVSGYRLQFQVTGFRILQSAIVNH